jgi:signal transduction histidine kinase
LSTEDRRDAVNVDSWCVAEMAPKPPDHFGDVSRGHRHAVIVAREMHMRRIPIRMKLAAALAVPLIGLFFITVVEVAETAADVDDVRAQTALARASVGPSGVITAMQNERTWAVVEMIGQENAVQPPVEGYDESRRLTDEAITAFRETLEGGSEAASEAYAQALGSLDGLDDLRATIDGNTAPRDIGNVGAANEVYDEYFALIRPFLDANSRVALAIDDAELRQATSLVDTTTRQLETLSELARSSILEITLGGGLDKPSEIASIARLRSTFDAGNKRLVEAPPPFDAVIGPEYPSGLVEGFTGELDKALTGEPPDMASMLATLNVPRDEGYMGVRNALVDALNERADELNAAAERRERIYVAMAIVTLVVAVGLTWAVSRSITRPLRALTRQAKDMADHRLPDAVTDILETPLGENITVPRVDPVRIRTRDEVSDVADALNTVQDTALDLAVEQAVLRRNIADSFVNLGRRNQNLLGRQLDFITELESNETNADTLSNLFRLDHLATRMRRNAESLLVLAGIEPPRQWAAPVRLTDVIRAALGEVENYQRVAVRGVEPATIIGSAAADLAHLLAELIENSLVFSPPDRSVDIRGRNRDDGGYTLAVIDTGLGMCRPPTGASPGPRASLWPRRNTWATTWPATSPPATRSTSGSTPRRARGSRPRSRCPPACSRPNGSPARRSPRPTATTRSAPRWRRRPRPCHRHPRRSRPPTAPLPSPARGTLLPPPARWRRPPTRPRDRRSRRCPRRRWRCPRPRPPRPLRPRMPRRRRRLRPPRRRRRCRPSSAAADRHLLRAACGPGSRRTRAAHASSAGPGPPRPRSRASYRARPAGSPAAPPRASGRPSPTSTTKPCSKRWAATHRRLPRARPHGRRPRHPSRPSRPSPTSTTRPCSKRWAATHRRLPRARPHGRRPRRPSRPSAAPRP